MSCSGDVQRLWCVWWNLIPISQSLLYRSAAFGLGPVEIFKQPPQISFSMPTGEPKPAGSGFDRWLVDCAVGHWKSSRLAFPISNNQPLSVPPSVGWVLIFKQKHRCALAEVTPHSVIAEWTQFPLPSLPVSSNAKRGSEQLWAFECRQFCQKVTRSLWCSGCKEEWTEFGWKRWGSLPFNPCQSCLPERSKSWPHKQCKWSGSGGVLLRKEVKV